MQRHSGGHGASSPRRGGPDPRRARLLALVGALAVAVALQLAAASAGSVGDLYDIHDGSVTVRASEGGGSERGGSAPDDSAPDDSAPDDKGAAAPAPTRSPRLLGLGVATAARCGPELTSPEGIEAQTCVLTQGEETWARTYYRNATGDELSSVLSLMGPDGRTVQMNCAVGAEDDPGVCETPRERVTGGVGAYTAVAEFAKGAGARGPLLLRSGSNSEPEQGS
ncbi:MULTISPECIES: hypothetical protein [Streptomyces]|uniref:DUF3558 domain-containing protein n=1 Tax=Streptomyces dengpaensis TaxID=2049881 RepID=A0ABM6STW8_9ACTN|nr:MULTISPECIES: hypothetical protein [Streptomyces]AVH57751.1 hypothetical protein C4B68_20455 [Streptomyces dengpaensis]PIB07742.1 hypothetical protein B1C81_17325 [Streptomyces sp. HG99]